MKVKIKKTKKKEREHRKKQMELINVGQPQYSKAERPKWL